MTTLQAIQQLLDVATAQYQLTPQSQYAKGSYDALLAAKQVAQACQLPEEHQIPRYEVVHENGDCTHQAVCDDCTFHLLATGSTLTLLGSEAATCDICPE